MSISTFYAKKRLSVVSEFVIKKSPILGQKEKKRLSIGKITPSGAFENYPQKNVLKNSSYVGDRALFHRLFFPGLF